MFLGRSLSLFSYAMTLSLALTFSACSAQDKNENLMADNVVRARWTEVEPDATLQVKVLNTYGEPITQAKVLIGLAQGIPFAGNFIETNASGVAQVPKAWTTAAHVTVDAPGYIRQTLLNQKPGNLIIKLHNAYLSQPVELNGQVTQLPVTNGDKLIDFGLVMPALTRADILNFDLDQVISPFNDILSVMGQKAPLPSNVSLPTQKESYIFNLTISKPTYRLMLPTMGPKTFFAARGRFPFKPVVDQLRNGAAFFEVLNQFSILGGGLRDVLIAGPQSTLDIPGNELEFKSTAQIQSATTQPDELLLMLVAADVNGTLIPTDVKKIGSNQSATLSAMTDKPSYVVSVLKKQSEFMQQTPGADRLSAAMTPYKANDKQTLLPLVTDPSISGSDSFVIQLPPAPTTAGINGIAISAVISDLYPSANGDQQINTALHRWEILGLGWSSRLQLPSWPLPNPAPKRKIEINFIGSTTDSSVNLDDSIIQAATHVSHASAEF